MRGKHLACVGRASPCQSTAEQSAKRSLSALDDGERAQGLSAGSAGRVHVDTCGQHIQDSEHRVCARRPGKCRERRRSAQVQHNFCTVCACLVLETRTLNLTLRPCSDVHGWDPSCWTPNQFWTALTRDGAFTSDAADCVLVSVLGSILLPALACLAIRFGQVDDSEDSPGGQSESGEQNEGLNAHLLQGSGSELEPAAEDDATGAGSKLSQAMRKEEDERREGVLEAGGASGLTEAQEKEKERLRQMREHERSLGEHKEVMNRQNSVMVALFIIASALQIYSGVKCIGFNYTNEVLHGTLMGLGVLWVNMLAWVLRELVEMSKRAGGALSAKLPDLHPHTLRFTTKVANHSCDVCGLRLEGGKGYRCKLCDYDLCVRCFTRVDLRTTEGVLRGDKGVRKEETLSTIKYFQRALGLARQQWQLFVCALLMLACNNGTRLFTPHIQGAILDQVASADALAFTDSITLYVIASLLGGLFQGAQQLSFSIIGRRLANLVRNRLFTGIVRQDVAFFDGNSSGQLTSRLSNDANFTIQPVQTMMGNLLSNLILLVGGVGMCFYTSWRLSMLAFATVGPVVHVTQVYAQWSQNLNRRIFAALGAANGLATETLSNIRTVKAMSTEQLETDNYRQATLFALREGVRDAWGSAGMSAINSYLDLGAGVLILWYGGWLAIQHDGRLTAGRLITYQLYWNMMNGAYQALVDIVNTFTRAAGAAQRVFALMDSLPDIDPDVGKVVLRSQLQGRLTFDKVEFTYQMRPDHPVIKGLTLDVPAGSTCALVGRSGSGKSTLVHLLLRFYDPSAGCVRLDGVPLPEWNLRSLHRQVALVAQDTQLFAGTILDNITYGLDEDSYTRADVEEAARGANAFDFVSELPEGFLTRVGERGTRMSGGQKQRIAIARCLLRKAKILLLDEATSALDAESEASVQQALDKLISSGGATVILVAHRLSTVMNAHKIAVVNSGNVIEEGNHDELIARNGAYSMLVHKQLSRQAKVVEQVRVATIVQGKVRREKSPVDAL